MARFLCNCLTHTHTHILYTTHTHTYTHTHTHTYTHTHTHVCLYAQIKTVFSPLDMRMARSRALHRDSGARARREGGVSGDSPLRPPAGGVGGGAPSRHGHLRPEVLRWPQAAQGAGTEGPGCRCSRSQAEREK